MAKRKNKGLTFKQFHWLFYIAIVLVATIYFVVTGFFVNCIWHPTWHLIRCFEQQLSPAQQKALESTSDFMPELKIQNVGNPTTQISVSKLGYKTEVCFVGIIILQLNKRPNPLGNAKGYGQKPRQRSKDSQSESLQRVVSGNGYGFDRKVGSQWLGAL